MDAPDKIWKNFPELNWSNRMAPDDVWIACALSQPRLLTLIAIAKRFGIERLEKVWEKLKANGDEEEIRMVARTTERMLSNIKIGFGNAAS